MTTLLLSLYLALQAAVIVLRHTQFRAADSKPAGVRVIEVSTVACIVFGVALVQYRDGGSILTDALACIAAVASAALLVWTCRTVRPQQFGVAFSPEIPSELVCRGPYRFVRNPFYLAYLLAHAVPVLASRSPWALLAWAGMALLYRHAALLEERKFLRSPLADEYTHYARGTGRFLPRLPQR